MTLLALKSMGLTNIYLVDVIQKRLDMAVKLGARNIINAKEDAAVELIMSLTGGKGCDLAIETAGTQITTNQCIDVAKKGATVVLVGYSSTKTVFRYRHVYPMAIEAVAAGVIDPQSVVSNIYDFDDIQIAMDLVSTTRPTL
jgi:L-iditol 2-dehydrogenase